MTIKERIDAGQIQLNKEKRRYECVEHPDRPDFGCEACFSALKATGEYYGTRADGGYKS